jgi:hypothetical protein
VLILSSQLPLKASRYPAEPSRSSRGRDTSSDLAFYSTSVVGKNRVWCPFTSGERESRSRHQINIYILIAHKCMCQDLGYTSSRWLKGSARNSVSQRTFERYEQVVRLHFSPEIGMSKLRDLSPHASSSFLQEKARRDRSVLGQRRPKLDYEEGPSALVGVGKA